MDWKSSLAAPHWLFRDLRPSPPVEGLELVQPSGPNDHSGNTPDGASHVPPPVAFLNRPRG